MSTTSRPSSLQRDLIYDVGMSDGSDTDYYLAKGFRVVAIEANPLLCAKARERFHGALSQGRLTILEKAIAPESGTIEFGIHREIHEWSSCMPDRLARMGSDMDIIKVECARLDSIINQHGLPYYIKIDIEGADLAAIESLGSLSEFPRYVSAEAHSIEIVERLVAFGYRRFKIVDQGKNASRKQMLLRLFTRSREGRFVNIRFTSFHSGPFGLDAPGKWVSSDKVTAQYRALVEANQLNWHDFHASL